MHVEFPLPVSAPKLETSETSGPKFENEDASEFESDCLLTLIRIGSVECTLKLSAEPGKFVDDAEFLHWNIPGLQWNGGHLSSSLPSLQSFSPSHTCVHRKEN